MPDDRLAELAALEQFGVDPLGPHETFEVVGDLAGADRTGHALDNQIGRLGPAQIPQHHLAGQDDASGVDLVLVGVFGCGAVCGFEDRVARVVVDVPAGCDANPADLSCEGVGEVIAVEVQRGDVTCPPRTRTDPGRMLGTCGLWI